MTEQLTEEYVGTEPAAEPAAPAPVRISWAPVPKVNLLPIEIVERRRFRRTQILLGGAVLGALVLAGAGTYWAQRGVDDAGEQLSAADARVAALQSEQNRYIEVPQVRAQVDAAESARALALGSDVLWYRYLSDLDGARPGGVKFSGITMTMSATSSTAAASANPLSSSGIGSIVVNGEADQYSEVASWITAVDKITGFSSSTLTSATKDEDDVTFNTSAIVDTDALSGRYDKKAG
jgi:outer membrane murein-binding lipoprotein Lpp